jgi:hypothetical protein
MRTMFIGARGEAGQIDVRSAACVANRMTDVSYGGIRRSAFHPRRRSLRVACHLPYRRDRL